MSEEYMRLPSVIFCLLLCAGWYLVFAEGSMGTFSDAVRKDSDASMMLKRSGLPVTASGYYRGLFAVSLGIFMLSLMKAFKAGQAGPALAGLLGSVYVFWLFRPVPTVFGSVRSLFAIFTEALGKEKARRLDKDLYSSCIVLKNLSIVQQRAPLSADMMLEKLAKCSSKELRPYYATLLSMYRTGRQDEAFRYFASSIGTPFARAAAGLLSKLDKIDPYQLKEQTQALIDAMKEKRITDGYRQAQRSGVITLALATASIMIGMLDFLVVVVYMDLLQMLTTVW